MASDEVRQDMVDQVRAEQQQQRKQTPKGPRATKPARDPRSLPPGGQTQGGDASGDEPPEAMVDAQGDAPRKRRRRRRTGDRGAGEGGASPSGE